MSKRIKCTAEEREQAVIQDYKDAYRSVYGIYPTVQVVGIYIRVSGQAAGVTLRRLKTLTVQLKNKQYLITHTPSPVATKRRPLNGAGRH